MGVAVFRPVRVGEIPQATAELAWRVHPRGTDEMRVRDALGPLFADEDFVGGAFTGMYSDLGQPGISPGLLAMVTVLQFLHRLSDREAVEAMADRISWKYALGLELGAGGCDASVLCEFRARLARGGRADAVFDVMIGVLREAGLVRERGRARTDSTHVLGAVRAMERIELIGESLRCALEEIAGLCPGLLAPLLDEGWARRYGQRVELGRLLGRGSVLTSADKLARQIAADGAALLEAIEADPAARWAGDLPQVKVMRAVWDQQIAADGAGWRLKEPGQLPASAERIRSPYDPDVRYSTKSRAGQQDLEWIGTKVHLTESCDRDLPHLVTDVHTAAATEPDVLATGPILEKLAAREVAPAVHLLDAGYPSAENITRAAAAGTVMITPVLAPRGRNANTGLHTPYDFEIDWEHGYARCPAGAHSGPPHPGKHGLVTFTFTRRDCTPCPQRDQCTRAKPPTARRITVPEQPVHDAVLKARAAQAQEGWQQLYNQRAGIEGAISEAVRGPDLRHARYRGTAKTHVQNIFTGIAMNISRLGTHYYKPPAPRRPTKISALCQNLGLTPT